MATFLFKLHSFIQYKLSIAILLSFLFYGCLSVKPTTTKSGKNYFETFYVGEAGTQYFIKPLLFENNESNKDLFVDITFRYKKEIKDSAILNFSIKSPTLYKSIDSLAISNRIMDIKSDNVDFLFSEKTKKGFVSRFTTKIALDGVKEMFNNDEWDFTLYNKNQTVKYASNKKTNKAINTLKDKVFILMQDS